MAKDLELFAKYLFLVTIRHAKRSVINTDDVKVITFNLQ